MKVVAETTALGVTEFSETFREQVELRLKPPLKWAGGKRWQVPHLRVLRQNPRSRLVEPRTDVLRTGRLQIPSRQFPCNQEQSLSR